MTEETLVNKGLVSEDKNGKINIPMGFNDLTIALQLLFHSKHLYSKEIKFANDTKNETLSKNCQILFDNASYLETLLASHAQIGYVDVDKSH